MEKKILLANKTDCCGCSACVNTCPMHCISMEPDAEGFLYPRINNANCVNCGKCISACPIIGNDKKVATNGEISLCYAMYNYDNNIRAVSSSGGVFYAIASKILSVGGVVVGARFDEKYNVIHDIIFSKNELPALIGSKYVQSSIGNTYKRVRHLLDTGTTVLFSGTPCQIGGLYQFLGNNYDNLFTQDIVCHGVPSSLFWHSYLDSVCKEAYFVSFRDKSKGWSKYSVRINNKIESHERNTYINAFVRGLSLRPSCYKCKFKGKGILSDITLGDLWGASSFDSSFCDDKGISLVTVNSTKGKILLSMISEDVFYKTIDLTKAIAHNPSYAESTTYPKNRDLFVNDYLTMGYEKAMKKWVRKNIFKDEINKLIDSIYLVLRNKGFFNKKK